jgi:ATP/maltotriose-dependent transcriptional regulator MalT
MPKPDMNVDVLPPPKLNLPKSRGLLLDRPRLLARLTDTPITALIASAGSGKSTLAMQWATAFEGAVFWLTLTPQDDQPRVFWSFALNLVRVAAPHMSELPALLLAQEGDLVSQRFVEAFLEELRALSMPIGFVVDESQFIQNPVLIDSLVYFAAHLPAQTQVLFVGRSLAAPLLAQAQVVNGLHFTMDEAAQYLTDQSAEPPNRDTITRVTTATQGWVMGVKLARIALQDSQTVLERTTSYSTQYLMDEALRQLPSEQLDFVQRTCISDTLNPALCAALTGRNDSAAQLETLMQIGLFITRVTEAPPTYRYHPLFRETLLSRHPEVLREAHRRAAAWYAASGLYQTAAEQAHASGDSALAAHYVMESSKQSMVDYDPVALLKWVKTFPVMLFYIYPRLSLFAIMSNSDVNGDVAVGQAYLEQLQAHPAVGHLRGEILLAQAYLNAKDFPVMLDYLEQALVHLPHDALYAYILGITSLIYIVFDQPVKARDMMEAQYRLAHDIGSKATILHSLRMRIYFHLADEDFENVAKMVEEGLSLLNEMRRTLGRWALEVERTLRYEGALALSYRGELDALEQMLLPTFQQIEWVDANTLALLYCLRGGAAVLRRDSATAETAYKNAALLRGGDWSDPFHLLTQIERMRFVLRYHDVREARLWLDNLPKEALPWDIAANVAYITAHANIVIGEFDLALESLAELEQQYVARGQPILVTAVMGAAHAGLLAQRGRSDGTNDAGCHAGTDAASR